MFLGIGYTEGHTHVLELIGMNIEARFSTVLFRYINLPIAIKDVYRCEDMCTTEVVDTFAHVWKVIRFFDCHRN